MGIQKTFTCPNCQAALKFNLDGDLNPKQARCPACRKWIRLPEQKDGKSGGN